MTKKLKEGDEVALRVRIDRIWPNGEITVFIKSASAGGKLTLLSDADIIEETKKARSD
jgi:hypothetical protein